MSRLWSAAAVAAGLVWAGVAVLLAVEVQTALEGSETEHSSLVVATWLLPVAAGLTALAAWLRGRR